METSREEWNDEKKYVGTKPRSSEDPTTARAFLPLGSILIWPNHVKWVSKEYKLMSDSHINIIVIIFTFW